MFDSSFPHLIFLIRSGLINERHQLISLFVQNVMQNAQKSERKYVILISKHICLKTNVFYRRILKRNVEVGYQCYS